MIPGSANPLLMRPAATTGVSRSIRLNAPDSAYLSRTPASAGNRKTWTWAGWVKRSAFANQFLFRGGTTTNDTQYLAIDFTSSHELRLSSATTNYLITTQVFRDASAWYHIVIAFDVTQGTNSNKAKFYVNGTEITTFSTDARGSLSNQDYGVNQAQAHVIGGEPISSNRYLDGLLADIYFIDGQALTPSSFTETDATTGQLVKKAYTGSFTGNSFYLTFEDNSAATATTLGKDSSGLGNNWTPNNLSVTAGAGNDSLVDVPTNGTASSGGDAGGTTTGNYPTLNPLAYGGGTLSNGNLDYAFTSNGDNLYKCLTTVAVNTGKWYFEFTPSSALSMAAIGITANIQGSYDSRSASDPNLIGTNGYPGGKSYEYAWRAQGNKINNATFTAYGTAAASGDVMMCAFDVDAGKIWFGRNGTWFDSSSPANGTSPAFSGFSGTVMPIMGSATTSSSYTANGSINFGQRPFAYTAPSGFKALCTTNLPIVITKPSTVFDTLLWTGNGSARSITGLGFNPDLVWIKSRSAATDHELTDSVRGTTKSLSSNLTAAEATDTGGLTAFNSDGFSLGTDTKYNNNAATYAGWCWDAGSSTTTIAANAYSAGVPSITSSVRANTTAGFSIVTFTSNSSGNATVGHGLGVAPSLVILKNRTGGAGNWLVFHKAVCTKDNFLYLNSTNALGTYTDVQGAAIPSSTVFGINAGIGIAGSADCVAYCFAPVVGYSSFGSYSGTSTSDGSFVYCGFRPKFVLIKNTDGSSPSGIYNWVMYDSVRGSYNVNETTLYSNTSDQENTTNGTYNPNNKIDFLSNGFKIRGNSWQINRDGTATYIYAAFAESPFNYARAR